MGDALLPKWRSEGEAALETLSGDLNPSGTIVIGRGQGLGKIAVGKVDDASARFLTHSTEGFRLAIASASGDAIYACSDYGPLRRFDSASGTLTLEIALGGRSCTAIAASPDNRFVAIADEHGNIDVFSAASASRIKTLNGPMRKLSELAFGPTSNEITAVDDEERLHIFSCDACLDVTELVVLARSRLTRVLKDEERVLLGGVPVSWLHALRGLFR
jgi:WD40 repeat protein